MSTLRNFSGDVRFHRLLVVVTLFVFPFAYLLNQALFDPAIEFLVPSRQAEWALHPIQDILNLRAGKVSRDVEFARDFTLHDVPTDSALIVRAFNVMRVFINGAEITPEYSEQNWKRPIQYRLSPHLQNGSNRLLIRVQNYGAIPALLVEAPQFLRTPNEWKAALEPNFDDFRPVVRPLIRSSRAGPLQQWSGWAWAKWLAMLWLLGIAWLILWVIVAHCLKIGESKPDRRVIPRWVRFLVPSVLLAACLWLNLTNTGQYPYSRSQFDWRGHATYVREIARTWFPPIATDGWQMFQPPAYYYGAAVVYRFCGGEGNQYSALKCVQYFGCLMGLGLVVLAWLYARLAFPSDPPAQWIALAFAAFLPMSVYMNPLITNEVSAGTTIAAATYALYRWGSDKTSGIRTAAFLGTAVSAGLMTKYAGFFVVIAGALMYGLRALQKRSRSEWLCLGVYVGVVILVCGWYYGRNVQIFGDPFVGNWDVSPFHYEQKPSFRTIAFYTQFGRVFFQHPEDGRWTTWLDGNFASMWADGHNNFFVDANDRAYLLQSLAIILAAFPSAAILLGIGITLISTIRQPASNPDLLLFSVPWFTWMSLVSFTMEVPTYSTVKAFFFLSSVPCLAVFLIRGRALFSRHCRPGRYLLDATITILCVLTFVTYRFLG